MLDLERTLRYLVDHGGSDLHLSVKSPPLVRIHGDLVPMEGSELMTPEDTERMLHEMLGDPSRHEEFRAEREVDFSFAIDDSARFRVNAFRQRGSVSLVARMIPSEIKTIEELNLPPAVSELAKEERGLILVTGTTGSGKSTTLAAIVDQINRGQPKHIVTIEDPIEFLHQNRCSVVNQREVGQDTASFGRALRRVLRQDPDVILIGEIRDEETVHTALSAAATGHLVLSTLHTLDAAETVNRVINFFPPHHQGHARAMLAGSLQGVVSQRLVPTVDGQGRAAVCEIMRSTGRIRDMIMDGQRTGEIPDAIAEGEYYGMQTFDQALVRLSVAGQISEEDALRAAANPSDFKLALAGAKLPEQAGSWAAA